MRQIEEERISRTDKAGAVFQIGRCAAEDLSCLMGMYHRFSPKPASQGLPPADLETCQRWLSDLIQIGENLLAWHEQDVVGHAVLIPDVRGTSGEYVIFVHQDYRNRGIGTALTQAILDKARDLGFQSVWLTVAITNFIAIKLYVKLGFQYCDMEECERTMRITL
ncbi:MAG: GNAT family N-acetyltransferase [Deltaproteobacteria bacterium]